MVIGAWATEWVRQVRQLKLRLRSMSAESQIDVKALSDRINGSARVCNPCRLSVSLGAARFFGLAAWQARLSGRSSQHAGRHGQGLAVTEAYRDGRFGGVERQVSLATIGMGKNRVQGRVGGDAEVGRL